jgi:hypothetical protein
MDRMVHVYNLLCTLVFLAVRSGFDDGSIDHVPQTNCSPDMPLASRNQVMDKASTHINTLEPRSVRRSGGIECELSSGNDILYSPAPR